MLRKNLLPVCLCAVVSVGVHSALADAVGFREARGVHVASGSQTLSGGLAVSPQGEFVKTGAGTLEVPMDGIENGAPYTLVVADGKLSLTGAQGTPSATPPAFVTEKAAFWVDASELTEGDTVTTWNDKRSGVALSATVKYRNAPEETPPVVMSTNGLKGVYFGGKSGKWMRFQKNGSDSTLENVHHFFLVHGVFNVWSPVLGYVTQSRGEGMLTSTGSGGGAFEVNFTGNRLPIMFDARRGDLDFKHFAARFFLDGRQCDPYSRAAHAGFQLFEGDLLTSPAKYQSFFYNYFETYKNDVPGGDYLCEAILFSVRLTEDERLAVERYLMAKWNLPQTIVKATDRTNNTAVSQPRATGRVRTAAGATVEVTVDAGAESVPLAFDGAGDVVKKGAGTLVLGAADTVPGTGSFTLEAGDVLLRGGALPPVALGAGETWNVAAYPDTARPDNYSDLSDAKVTFDMESGLRIAKTSGDGATAVKTGDGALCVGEVATNVRRVVVQGGTLELTARETPLTETSVPADGLEVPIPNHSFELPFKVIDNNRGYRLGSFSNEWYNLGGGNGMQFVTTVPPTGYSAWTAYAFPDGTNALMVVQEGGAETVVTVPRAGEYELSFWATSRYGDPIGSTLSTDGTGIKRSVVNLRFAGRVVGRVQVNKGEFYRFRHRFTVTAAEAGVPQRLGFKSLRAHTDCCLIIDDVHLRAVPTPDRTDVVKVPGGDFEQNDIVGATSSTPGIPACFSRQMCVDGWTLSLDGTALTQNPTNGYVAVATPATLTYHSGYYRTPLFPFADPGCGSAALAFLGTAGVAESSEFTLPAGRWILRGRLAAFPLNATIIDNGEKNFVAVPQVRATLLRGGTEFNMGVGGTAKTWIDYVSSHIPEPYFWTNVVEVAADETVRLRLAGAGGGSTIDDLEFVPASAAQPEVNLIANPCFERYGNGWGAYIPNGDVVYESSYPNHHFAYLTDTWAFGYGVHFGSYCARLHNNGGVYTSVAFPAPGLYRLTMHIRPRADETGTHNPVLASVVMNDGSTNAICRIDVPTTRSFVERSCLFRMTEAGVHRLNIQGLGVPSGVLKNGKDTANLSTLLDGVSLVKVDETAQTPPTLPERLRIDVAAGARLALNYPGTNKVASVRFDGTAVDGRIVDATTHPEYVTGIGALEVVPRNMVILLR